jgi:hypothetical protein
VHADDLLSPNYVNDALAALDSSPNIDVFHFQTRIINSRGRVAMSMKDLYKKVSNIQLRYHLELISGDLGLARILKSNFIYCPSLVFSAASARNLSFDTRWKMVSDLALVSRFLLEDKNILSLPQRNYFYRRHDQSLSSKLTSSFDRFEEEFELYLSLVSSCQEKGFRLSSNQAARMTSIRLHIAWIMFNSLMSANFVRFLHAREFALRFRSTRKSI